MSKKVLVIGEAREGSLRNVTFEAIAAANIVSDGGEVVGVLCGDGDLNEMGQEMVYYGASRVITISNPDLKTYTSDGYGQAVYRVIEDESPEGIIMGHTAIGKDLTPKLASKLESGLISDATEVVADSGRVVFTRPIYSGKAFEKKEITDGLVFATIRPNNIPAFTRDDSLAGNISEKEVEISNIRTIIKDVLRKSSDGVDLSEAKVIVAGGRGVKSSEGFEPLEELASVLGGTVGASRGACDAGYCDYSLQIGQTGKVVTPDLYIACGISGAIQHLAGMSNSKVIVAINKDPEANIFNVADYGIVGDLFDVVPKLMEEIKQMKVNA
ncbi:electron transfer flavoprotein alpha subunit apoprotein [Halobacillus karajensis]|uniref:Electron transfer flavoprotein large subunit n=1 Tax=Halobacillus karajensis TaxID=195088 RepID=A0A024P739_9BACI|nr:electron transfer flavoprotein subunit alpha/FixB family protein [Halobacillus karajensis]CDQ18236.1 Electron transfer flavoprotein large subunit [Halobacillus karajensis]CDQ24588.1 Electron transfer flavoprotein large subunit [Halobacillus karajensis]CDQ29165.1 Electron transfer flavoprotein large subunit [Halobacillus karajensis]SEH56696.1 electron transfer flavoprotein alpha subunit apoprotein [Halobacillus karajensis]